MNFNIVLDFLCIIILVILHVWITMDMMLERKRKVRMNICILLVFISLVSEIVFFFVNNTVPELRMINIIFNTIAFFITPFIFIVESHFYNNVFHKGHFLCYVPAIINAILVLLSPFTGMIFRVSVDNQYARGEYYYLYAIAFTFSILYSLYKKLGTMKSLPAYFFYRSMLTSVLLYPTFLIQVFFPGYRMNLLIITIHLLFCLSFSSQIDNLLDNQLGLLNRNAFDKHIETLRTGKNQHYAIIMFDVDNFKILNDKHGHALADKYLNIIAGALKDVYKSHVYRYGGDEFVVVLPTRNEDKVKHTLSVFIQKIITLRETDINLPTVSYGYALYNHHQHIDDVLKNADKEMYAYKNKEKLNK